MPDYNRLSVFERDEIALLTKEKIGVSEIARLLDRAPSTISEEIRRNSSPRGYRAGFAQRQAEQRKLTQRKARLIDDEMQELIIDKLQQHWTPQRICQRLRREGVRMACCETIYQFIYGAGQRLLRLWEYLPRHKRKRGMRKVRGCGRGKIPNRKPLSERPIGAMGRRRYGHFEADLVIGRDHKSALMVLIERKTRFLFASKLPRADAVSTLAAWQRVFSSLPLALRRTLTLDNGLENVLHQQLEPLGITAYFTDRGSPWQKGQVENHNALIRRYLPRGFDFREINETELQDIIAEINNYPKQCLDWRTPTEAFENMLKSKEAFG